MSSSVGDKAPDFFSTLLTHHQYWGAGSDAIEQGMSIVGQHTIRKEPKGHTNEH